MAGCDRCSGDDNLGYSCNYCAGSFCSKHRLPEKHNCPGLRNATSQGPDFRGVFDSGSGFLARVFGDTETDDDAISRESHPGKKDYGSDIHTDPTPVSYEPETSSPDVAPDGSIRRLDGEEPAVGSKESRLRVVGLTLIGLCIFAVTFPLRLVRDLPSYLTTFNRWLGQLLGSLYGLARTLAPVTAILLGALFVAGLIGTGIPMVDDNAQGTADVVGGFLDAKNTDDEQGDHEPAGREHTIEQAIHEEVNDVRSKRDRSTLTYDHGIAAVAKNHSQDMAERDFFRHRNPDDQGSADRLRAAGIQCQATGENIYREEGFDTDPDRTAERVVEHWLNSPGHRENLLRRGWTGEGIGVEIRGEQLWVTQNFCGNR